MPPKKEPKEELPTLWGRPGTTLKMGIVGLPNVGKSTTFNLMSKLNVPAQNYSFCTVEPNLARVNIPDERLDKLSEIHKTKSKIQATLEIVDIAGLVRGAAQGAGLGNHFLSHIKEVDGIYHVVRAFDDEDITHEENSIDPVRDMEIIRDELVAKDLEFIEKRIAELESIMKRGSADSKKAEGTRNLLLKVQSNLEQKVWVRCIKDLQAKDIETLNQYCFITAKPVVYLINLSQKDYIRKKNKHLPKVVQWIKENIPGVFIPYSADFEKQCVQNPKKAEDDDKQMVPQELITSVDGVSSQITNIIKQGFKCLDLIYFFTAGPPECRCWTVRKFSKAPQAAGRIHTDFENGFICAETMKYDDFIAAGGVTAKVKELGKYRQQGKEYVVEDGDIIYFRFNVSKGKK